MPSLLFSLIDELSRSEHYYVSEADRCYYLREYTPRRGPTFSETNQLIYNLKKLKGTTGYNYKASAIRQAGAELRDAIGPAGLKETTFVPMPPSKVRTDPQYDDRMVQIVRGFCGTECDWRELLLQRESVTAAHEAAPGSRPKPPDLERVFYVNEAVAAPEPSRIALVDDVLTAGAHFVAGKAVLQRRFAGAEVIGIFYARTARERPPPVDPADLLKAPL